MGWVDTGAERWRDPRGPTIRPPSRVRTRTLLVLVSAVVGFIIGVQARQSGAPGGRLAAESPEDLTRILGDLNAEADSLAQEISTLRVKLLRYRSSAERDELLLADARKTLADLQVLGGVVPATGPGVALMIDDPDGQVGWDGLLDLVQELRDAGAEALAVNGHRVVASTWFGPATRGATVDGETIASPYDIEAIGAPRVLRQALEIPGGPLTFVAALPGVEVGLREADRLILPALKRG